MNFQNPQYKKRPFGALVIIAVIILLILLILVIRGCNHHENSATNNVVEEITTQEIRVTDYITSTVDLKDNTQQKHIGDSLKNDRL